MVTRLLSSALSIALRSPRIVSAAATKHARTITSLTSSSKPVATFAAHDHFHSVPPSISNLLSSTSTSYFAINPANVLYRLPSYTQDVHSGLNWSSSLPYIPSPHVNQSHIQGATGDPRADASLSSHRAPVERLFISQARPRIAIQTTTRHKHKRHSSTSSLGSSAVTLAKDCVPPSRMPEPILFDKPSRPRRLTYVPRKRIEVCLAPTSQ